MRLILALCLCVVTGRPAAHAQTALPWTAPVALATPADPSACPRRSSGPAYAPGSIRISSVVSQAEYVRRNGYTPAATPERFRGPDVVIRQPRASAPSGARRLPGHRPTTVIPTGEYVRRNGYVVTATPAGSRPSARQRPAAPAPSRRPPVRNGEVARIR